MTTLYGIPNCDTVKKARAWLSSKGVDYTFHDFKKRGLSSEILLSWIDAVGWERLINRQGTTWRKLAAEVQAGVTDAESAVALMQANPSIIKRPVLEYEQHVQVGFKPEDYEALTGQTT